MPGSAQAEYFGNGTFAPLMAEERPVRTQSLEVTREQARLWIERLDEWASAARELGYRSWSTEFTRQSAWLRAVYGRP